MSRRPRVAVNLSLAMAATALFGCAAVALFGCAALPLSTPDPGGATVRPPATRPAAPSSQAATHKVTNTFELTVTPPQAVMVGQPSRAKVRVSAREPYEITHDFPAQLSVRSGAHQRGLGIDEALVEARQLTFRPVLEFARSGYHTVSGKIRFSLCDKHTCLIESEAVHWTAVVKTR